MKILNTSRNKLTTAVVVVCMLAIGSYAYAGSRADATAAGSKPPGVHSAAPMQGYLKVYSATTQFCNSDGGFMYYPHTRYSILNTNGSRYKWVDNHVSDTDETPERVALPVGTYYVLAESEFEGLVKVPVVIKGGGTTVINLEKGRTSDPDTQRSDSSHAIKLPSGQVVGWQANH